MNLRATEFGKGRIQWIVSLLRLGEGLASTRRLLLHLLLLLPQIIAQLYLFYELILKVFITLCIFHIPGGLEILQKFYSLLCGGTYRLGLVSLASG